MAAAKVVLIGACGAQSDLAPFIAVACALRRRGHRPVIAADPAAADEVSTAAIAFQPLRPSPRDACADLGGRSYDLVFAPPQALAVRAHAEAHGVPWIAALTHPPVPPSPWQRLFSASDPMVAVRRTLGLHAPAPPRAILGLFSPALADAGELPDGALACGFAFHDRPRSLPAELMDFLEAGAAPIVFAPSAEGSAERDFFRIGIATAQRLGRRAVLLVGDGAVLGTPPGANIGVFAGAPAEAVMPRAAAIVHEGSIGATAHAMRAGKPMLVVPGGAEARDVARRCERLGLARVVARTAFTPRRAARQLAEMLADESMLRGAAAFGRRIAAENGASQIADVIACALSDEPQRSFG